MSLFLELPDQFGPEFPEKNKSKKSQYVKMDLNKKPFIKAKDYVPRDC